MCPNDQHWYLFILLLQIVNIVFSSVIFTGITIYLKHLIVKHHRLFKHLFPDKNLLPKHNFMVQYPRKFYHCYKVGACLTKRSITFFFF